MSDLSSKFNIGVSRVTYLVGDTPQVETLKKVLSSHSFLQLRTLAPGEEVVTNDAPFFFIQTLDFSNQAEVQAVAARFEKLGAPGVFLILVVQQPVVLNREQLLFTQEMGAQYVACGVKKHEDLREYVKRYCVEMAKVGSLAHYEQELKAVCQAADLSALTKIVEKMREFDDSSEQAMRILAQAYLYREDWKRAEVQLKRLLQMNAQNLWAANNLGKVYLKTKRGAQGIELLTKLSSFHDLHGERLLALGNACAQAGMANEAESSFQKGDQLADGEDLRFKDGLVKVRLMERDFKGSMKLLDGRALSYDVIAFLNLRAIMAMRVGKFDEGFEYYNYAFSGAREQVVKSKVLFNLGLGYLRQGDLQRGSECFKDSLTLGGPSFARAKIPLEKITAIIASRGDRKNIQHEKSDLSSNDWENLFQDPTAS